MDFFKTLKSIGKESKPLASSAAGVGAIGLQAAKAALSPDRIKKSMQWAGKQIVFNLGDEVMTVVKLVNATCPAAREYIRSTLTKGYYKSPLIKEYFDKHVADHWQTGLSFVSRHTKDRNLKTSIDWVVSKSGGVSSGKTFDTITNVMNKVTVGDALSISFAVYSFADFMVVYFKNRSSIIAKLSAVVNGLATSSLTMLQDKSIAYDAFIKAMKEEAGIDALDAFLCLSYIAGLGSNANEIANKLDDVLGISLPKDVKLVIASNAIDLTSSSNYIRDAKDLQFSYSKFVQFQTELEKALKDEDIEGFEEALAKADISELTISKYIEREKYGSEVKADRPATNSATSTKGTRENVSGSNYDHWTTATRVVTQGKDQTNGAEMAAQGSQIATDTDLRLSEARNLRLEIQKVARIICGSEGDVIDLIKSLNKLNKVDTKILEVVCYQQF